MKKMILLIPLIVLVSGCVGLDSIFGSSFGQDTLVLSADILTIGNVNIIPPSPIFTGTPFTFSLEVANVDDIEEAKGVNFTFTDAGRCDVLVDNAEVALPKKEEINTMYPKQTEYLEWDMQTPSAQETGNLPSKCDLRYTLEYNFSARSQIDSSVIGKDLLSQMQRAGETPSFTPAQVIGKGPIKLNFEFDTPQPLNAGKSFNIFFYVNDAGTGLLSTSNLKGNIPKASVFINVSKDIYDATKLVSEDLAAKPCGDYFVEAFIEDDYVTYTNSNEEIPMIRRASPKIRCTFTAPPISDQKTYFWSASYSYNYRLDGVQSLDVKPYLQ